MKTKEKIERIIHLLNSKELNLYDCSLPPVSVDTVRATALTTLMWVIDAVNLKEPSALSTDPREGYVYIVSATINSVLDQLQEILVKTEEDIQDKNYSDNIVIFKEKDCDLQQNT